MSINICPNSVITESTKIENSNIPLRFSKANPDIINYIQSKGYKHLGHGYFTETTNNTHWVSILEDSIQMYAYFSEDQECENIYDTGIIKPNLDELKVLVDVFLKHI